MARQPVKVTYAHKRGRAKATAKLASSPLEDLPPGRDDITRSEMSRRMLKRSRRISHEDDDQIRLNERAVKRARQTVEPSQPNAFPVGANINTFQTPFPSAEYVHLSSVTRPLVPENLSPVPHAKRILSRTSSRNLKENDTSLASPFHSRSSSPRSPATAKTKARSYRIPLHSKSRTLPGTLQKNDSTNVCDILLRKDSLISLNDGKLSRQVSLNDSKLSRNHAIPSLNQLVRNSPSKYRRYTSNLNPSYMLSHTLQKDCISQLGTLAIHAGNCGPDPELLIRPCPTESSFTSPFLVDRPQFCSTPQHHLSGNRTGLQPPNPPSRMTFLTNPSHGARDEDFEMANCADVPKIPKIHIPGNSIISSSGSFTLRTRLNSHIPDVGDDHDINDSAGSAPMSISSDILPQKVSMGDNILPSHSRALGMDNSGSHCKISLGQSAVPLSGTSPLVSPVVSTRTAIGKQSVAFPISSPAPDTTDSAAKSARECIPLPLSPTRFGGSSGNSDVGVPSQADLVQDMLSLGLGGRNHDAGVHGTHPPARARSLDSPPVTISKKTSATKHKRNRAGTIRASDFARPASSGTSGLTTSLASIIAGPAGSLPGRTRSGTIVGPNSKLAVPLLKGAVKRRPEVQVTQQDISSGLVDELAIPKVQEGRGPWSTEDINYVGLAQRGKGKGRKGKVVHDEIMSDDPLLIVGPWKDEDWS